MPLKGSETILGEKLAVAMEKGPAFREAWNEIAEILLSHVREHSLVTGIAPNGGGPIAEGKIE